MRNLLISIFVLLFAMFTYIPMMAQEQKKSPTVQTEQSVLDLIVSSDTIRVQNASPGAVMEIYNILGVKINSFIIDSSDKTITLSLPKGYYIFKIENIVRKIVVK